MEVALKDEALALLDQTVGEKVEEIRTLQQENESLKTSVYQFNLKFKPLPDYARLQEAIDTQKDSEVVLVNQRRHGDSQATQAVSSPNHAIQDPKLTQEEEDSVLEELKSNGFPWSSNSALFWAARHGKVRTFQVGDYSSSFTDPETKMNYLHAASAHGQIPSGKSEQKVVLAI